MADSLTEQLERIQQLEEALAQCERSEAVDVVSPLRAHLAQIDAEAARRRQSEAAVLSAYGAIAKTEEKRPRAALVQPLTGIVITSPFLHPVRRKRRKPEVIADKPSFALGPGFAASCKAGFKQPLVVVSSGDSSAARERRRIRSAERTTEASPSADASTEVSKKAGLLSTGGRAKPSV